MTVSLLAAFVAVMVGFFAELTAAAAGPRTAPGEFIFAVLSPCLLILALLAGVFLAADGVSEERREGTLGLLFLTDLKGHDVVLGKFIAVGLNAFYSLLAIFPILAICLMAGGTTPGEFLRMTLALANALIFSIAAGLWVSSRSESSYQAMGGTLVLLTVVSVLLPLIGMLLAGTRFAMAAMIVNMVGPSEAFSLAKAANFYHYGGYFWLALGITHMVAWGFLGWASWRLPRFLELSSPIPEKGFWKRLLTANLLMGKRQRQSKWLDVNPVLWLLEDSSRLRRITWALAILGSAMLWACLRLGGMGGAFLTYAAWPFYFLLKILFVIQACRFFSESRRTGALELLCSTPLSPQSVIRGQWMALRRNFFWPVVLLMGTEIAVLFLMPSGNLFPLAGMMKYYFHFLAARQVTNSLADFWALGWFGMWLALASKKPGSAAGLTILLGLVLPAIAICLPTLAIDAVLIVVFRPKLLHDFRLQASPRP